MSSSKYFMAVSRGQSSKPSDFKRYTGVAKVKVLAVNPTKKELETIYGTPQDNDPVYVKEVEVGQDKHKVKMATVTFIVKTDESIVDSKGEPLDLISRVSFNIRQEPRSNNDKTKVQVIDKYGRTAWVTKEQFEKKEIPMYSNGPASLDKDYRPCYFGEENLTNFVRTYLNIKSVDDWKEVDGKRQVVGQIENPELAELRFDTINTWFQGDFSEIQEITSYQPENTIKILFGVRTADDNKKYQVVYTDLVLHPAVVKYDKLAAKVKERQDAGAYPNTVFEVSPLHEYVETATEFAAPSTAAPDVYNPFATPATPSYDPFKAPQATLEDVFNNSSSDDLPFGM